MWAGEGVGTYTKANLKKYAADLKLDAAQFNSCLDTEKYKFAIDADMAEAYRLGIPGTPVFIANDQPMDIQSLDFSEFASAFDKLAK